MPKRTIFEDAEDTFRVELGALVLNDSESEGVIVVSDNLRDFHTWLGEEIARLDAEGADNG